MKIYNSRALINFMGKSISAKFLIALVNSVLQALERNSRFPGVDRVLSPLKSKFDEFTAAWSAARRGSAEQKITANTLKGEVQELLKAVCEFVNEVAKGDRAALSTTNFDLSKEAQTLVTLTDVKDFAVKSGTVAGEMVLSYKKEKSTTPVYQYTYDLNPHADSKWISVGNSQKKCAIGGLTPGALVTFRILVAGPRKQSIYSNMISKNVGFGQ